MDTLGTITLTYNENGIFVTGSFLPALFSSDISMQLRLGELATVDEAAAQQHAQELIAAWFQRQNDIELSDREKYKIETTLETCEKWPNGHFKQAILTVKYIQREEAFAATS